MQKTNQELNQGNTLGDVGRRPVSTSTPVSVTYKLSITINTSINKKIDETVFSSKLYCVQLQQDQFIKTSISIQSETSGNKELLLIIQIAIKDV